MLELLAWLVWLGLVGPVNGVDRDPVLPIPVPPPAAVVEVPAPDITETSHKVVEFAQGYADAGGPPEVVGHLVYVVIPCESGWQLEPPASGFLGLAQFHPATWAAVAQPGADWRDPYEQGWAAGSLVRLIGVDRAGTTAGWPYCWWD